MPVLSKLEPTGRPATSEEIAFVAGLFEGEGCIYKCTSHSTKAGEKRYAWEVLITSTDLDVLERIQVIVDGGSIYTLATTGLSRKQCYEWRICSRQKVVEFLTAVEPWVGKRRRVKVLECLGFVSPPLEKVS